MVILSYKQNAHLGSHENSSVISLFLLDTFHWVATSTLLQNL